ncbi:MAG TPA: hypoxanthine phosphoribosyltransferase [candidate division Zixibacteria bacterium]|nr:hypoxanthine phosphoribosyltransferase [candidate division Zixibacteria bacterium]
MSSLTEDTDRKRRVELLLDQDRLAQRVQRMGARITEDYRGETPILMGILKGCFVFLADLVRAVNLPMEVDFVSAASFRQGTLREEDITIGVPNAMSVKGRHVLLVEGIVDTGRTCTTIIDLLRKQEPASIEVVTLLDKPASHRVKLDVKYKCFSVGNEFVIGFGLDNNQKYRNLPFVGKLVDR